MHPGGVEKAMFSPNGLYVLTTSSQDHTVRIWAADAGREIAVLASRDERGNRPALTRATFNSNGTSIAIVSGEERVRLIRTFPTAHDLIEFARRIVPRELTSCERRRFFLPVQSGQIDCPS